MFSSDFFVILFSIKKTYLHCDIAFIQREPTNLIYYSFKKREWILAIGYFLWKVIVFIELWWTLLLIWRLWGSLFARFSNYFVFHYRMNANDNKDCGFLSNDYHTDSKLLYSLLKGICFSFKCLHKNKTIIY